MTSTLKEWLVQNRDKVEEWVEIMGKASEVLAATVGQLHPVLEAVFRASAYNFNNQEGDEVLYLTDQFSKIKQKMNVIDANFIQIDLEQKKSSMNMRNFECEANILSQYDKFLDILNAKTDLKKKNKIDKFLIHFENTETDKNLDGLYSDITRGNMSASPMLDTVVVTKQRHRRAVENFCARLKKLFVMGIIAAMGYASLKEGEVKKEMLQEWQERMEDVENRMKAAVDDCTNNFAKQAKQDMEDHLQKEPGSVDDAKSKSLLDKLVKKYNWVSWSIRVFKDKEHIFFFNWLAGKKYHGTAGGDNYFDLMSSNNIKVVISFSVEPKPIDTGVILQQIKGEKLKGNMVEVAQVLSKSLDNRLVHAITIYKKVVETNNFPKECYYYEKHQEAYLCVHPE